MQSCYIGGSLQSLQGRAGIHNRPTVLTMPPIHLMQKDELDLTNRGRRRMKTPCRRSGRTMRPRNCNVKLDDLDWDRPDLDCELQQARGIPRNLRLDETNWRDSVVVGYGTHCVLVREGRESTMSDAHVEESTAAALSQSIHRLSRRMRKQAQLQLTASQMSALTTVERHG